MHRLPVPCLPAQLLLALLLLAPTGPVAAREPQRVHLAPSGWEGSYHRIHYTPVLRIGDRVIVSGIPALEGDSEEAKIRWAFRELQRHLEAAGATLADVVELHSFHVARDHDEFKARIAPVLKVHGEFFRDRYPAWTAVGTTALFSPDAPMEIRAEAVIGSGRAARVDIPAPKPAATP
jgi:enamine deaminase RidA (YjgF/YER057c/UK114 family)